MKVLPRATDLIGGPLLRSLRDLDLADLLGREHAPVDLDEISHYLDGRNGPGHRGRRLDRERDRPPGGAVQAGPAAAPRPRRELAARDGQSTTSPTPSPCSPTSATGRASRSIFERYRPDVVFHAAAHKHVPILERHPVEAAHTNLLGTWSLAQIAAELRVRTLRAHLDRQGRRSRVRSWVRRKRAAELVVFRVGKEHQLPFAAVRFGNVLGSRGSVVPTFLRQILEGGPVTVTDPEMTRYFMTIPEAVSLVLQAGAMADKGKVFLLDMGKPVSIIELARQMIRLAGLPPRRGHRDRDRRHAAG